MLSTVIALLSLIILVLLIYAIFIETRWYEITESDLHMRDLDPVFDGYRIAHISDIHMDGTTKRGWLRDIVERVNMQNPDLIVITGDFITRNIDRIAPELWHELANLQAADGVVAVMGNHDYLSNIEHLRNILNTIAIRELANDYLRIERSGSHFYIAGVDNVIARKARLDLLMAKLPDDAPAILLAHEPDFADIAARTKRFEAQLSGHTHGGQIRLPILGILYTPRLGQHYLYGYHILENHLQVYVTRGVGTVGLPLRFNCRPEITMHRLRAI